MRPPRSFPKPWAPVLQHRGPLRREARLEAQLPSAVDKFDDEDYPAYNMGRAAEILGVSPAFLRSLDEAKLIARSAPTEGTGATRATSCAWPPEPASWSTRAPRWRPRAASSS